MADTNTTPQPPDGFWGQFWKFVGIIGLIVAVIGLSVWGVRYFEIQPADNAVLGFLAITAIIIAFAGSILWKIVSGQIPLVGIISEPQFDELGNRKKEPGKASLSRFQFLLFTFVVAGLFLMLSIEVGEFVNIPANVLGLMGISGGSFIVSKAVGQADEKAKGKPVADPDPDPAE